MNADTDCAERLPGPTPHGTLLRSQPGQTRRCSTECRAEALLPIRSAFFGGNDWTDTEAYIDSALFRAGQPTRFMQPQYGALSAWSTIGNSNYNALALSLRTRLSSLTVDFNYTWSHSLDDASGLQSEGALWQQCEQWWVHCESTPPGRQLRQLRFRHSASDQRQRRMANAVRQGAGFPQRSPKGCRCTFRRMATVQHFPLEFRIADGVSVRRHSLGNELECAGKRHTDSPDQPVQQSTHQQYGHSEVVRQLRHYGDLPAISVMRTRARQDHAITFTCPDISTWTWGSAKPGRCLGTKVMRYNCVGTYSTSLTLSTSALSTPAELVGELFATRRCAALTPPSNWSNFVQTQGNVRVMQIGARYSF